MELVVALDARADCGEDILLEEVDANGGSHEVNGFEFPAFEAVDDIAVHDRSGRVADEVEPEFGGIFEKGGGEGVLVKEDGTALESGIWVSVGSIGDVCLFC